MKPNKNKIQLFSIVLAAEFLEWLNLNMVHLANVRCMGGFEAHCYYQSKEPGESLLSHISFSQSLPSIDFAVKKRRN